MSRAFLLTPLLLAACSSGETPTERAEAAKTADNGIECALAGAGGFERHCTVEHDGQGRVTIHHPDGGFRRLALAGRAVDPADGADKGEVRTLPDGRIEWAIDRDRYRLPAP